MTSNSAMSTRYAKSIEEQERRSRVIAGGVNSNVRLASRPAPLTFERAAGAHLWDVDGNEYIDYAGGMGPMLLGHNHPRVVAAVRQALEVGQCFAGQNEFEAEFGERLVAAVPWIESIRIGVAGSEMDLLAVRIARAATGRGECSGSSATTTDGSTRCWSAPGPCRHRSVTPRWGWAVGRRC